MILWEEHVEGEDENGIVVPCTIECKASVDDCKKIMRNTRPEMSEDDLLYEFMLVHWARSIV